MPVHTYDPAQVSVIVGGYALTGFADGSFVTVERDADAWALSIGSDGEGARSKSNNCAGKVTVRLMQTSASNDIMSAFAKADELANAGIVPLMVKDNSGRSLAVAENAWIKKQPSSEYGREAGTREWVIETENLQLFIGGN